MTDQPFYAPIGQSGGYDLYDSLTDLLSEGFSDSTPVEVDRGHGTDVETTTIAELRAWQASQVTTEPRVLSRYDSRPAMNYQPTERHTMTSRSPERIQFLKDVLITAVEGGINYWAAVADYDPDAGTVTVYEIEEGEWDPSTGYVEYPDDYTPHKVTLDTIAHGIGVLLEQRKGHDPKNYWHQFVVANRTNSEDGDYDAGQADDILQAGIFGEVVYA